MACASPSDRPSVVTTPMSGIELRTEPPAASTRLAKSLGTFPLSRKTCSPVVGTATRDMDNASFGVVGALVTASPQPAATTRATAPSTGRERANLNIGNLEYGRGAADLVDNRGRCLTSGARCYS